MCSGARVLLLAACAVATGCRSGCTAPGAGEDTPDPVTSAMAREIARSMSGPPPSSSGYDGGPEYTAYVSCPDAGWCVVDLTDDTGRALGRWEVAHPRGMTAALGERHVTRLRLTARDDVPYATVIEVLDAARLGGAGDVTFGPPVTVAPRGTSR